MISATNIHDQRRKRHRCGIAGRGCVYSRPPMISPASISGNSKNCRYKESEAEAEMIHERSSPARQGSYAVDIITSTFDMAEDSAVTLAANHPHHCLPKEDNSNAASPPHVLDR